MKGKNTLKQVLMSKWGWKVVGYVQQDKAKPGSVIQHLPFEASCDGQNKKKKQH